VFDKAEKDFDLVFNAIRTGRSLAAQYNLQSDIQCECSATRQRLLLVDIMLVSILAQTDAEATMFESQVPTIVSLTKGCKSANVARSLSDIPAGCGSSVLTSTIAVYLLVRV
jgi:valyl-tRNA synthetase